MLCFFKAKRNQPYFFNWIETEGGKGADEVGSCLLLFLMGNIEAPVTQLKAFCDTCGGQNRNFKLCLILMKILQFHPSLESIVLNFMVSGHSYLPNDADFGTFQSLMESQETIELPEDYRRLMLECRVNSKKVEVIEMTHNEFISSSGLVAGVTRRKKDQSGQAINFLKIRQIRLEKSQPSKIFIKYDIESNEVRSEN